MYTQAIQRLGTMGASIRTSPSLLLVILLSLLSIFSPAAAGHEKKQHQLKAAMVVGTVYCDTCFQQEFSKSSHFIQGASVTVECSDGATLKPSFQKEVKTNRYGVFRVRLPLKVARHADMIKACSVKLIRSNEPFCAAASSATSAGLWLKSKRNGLHVFSAGFFTFKPLKQPDLCSQEPKPSLSSSKVVQPAFFFFPPPIPFLPSPPNVGGVPLPPNPLMPPPSLLPPVIPSPPSSGGLPLPLPPNPLMPTPPSIVPPLPNLPPMPNLPPVPSLNPPAPAPPPAFGFPPFPFPPNPLFPGIPPASPPIRTTP